MKHLILLTDLCTEADKTTCPLKRGHKISLNQPSRESAIQVLPAMQWHEHESHVAEEQLYVVQHGIVYKFPRKCCSQATYGGGVYFLVAAIREAELDVIPVRNPGQPPERATISTQSLREISVEQLRSQPIASVMMHDANCRYMDAVTVDA